MTYCERCDKEKKEERRAHMISDNHLISSGEKYCNVCKKKYTTTLINGVYSKESINNHQENDSHEKKLEIGFLFYLDFFICLLHLITFNYI